MKPLWVLLGGFALPLIAMRAVGGTWNLLLAGNIAMSLMLGFTAIGHFAFTKGMAMMLPDPVPFKREVVWGTGLIEIAAAMGLLLPQWRHLTAVLLIVFFILILPANILAAIRHVDYQKGTFEGPDASYLWFRVPLQVLFIGWVWYFSW